MYVYFDITGRIKSISPVEDADLCARFSVWNFPLSEVEGFLIGSYRITDYLVKTSTDGTSHFIYKCPVVAKSYTRTLDRYLTEITYHSDSTFTIINDISNRNIRVRCSFDDGPLCANIIPLYFTKRHDPCFLKLISNISLESLAKLGHIDIPYDLDLTNSSVYTRRVLDSYSYKEVNDGV